MGFGPRDCSDYQTGISIIPIERLTDADQKWMLTAEYGGTGGKPITSGLVVEEPDIEIGAGVSSKGILLSLQRQFLLLTLKQLLVGAWPPIRVVSKVHGRPAMLRPPPI